MAVIALSPIGCLLIRYTRLHPDLTALNPLLTLRWREVIDPCLSYDPQ